MRTVRALVRQGGCPGWSLFTGRTGNFCCFFNAPAYLSQHMRNRTLVLSGLWSVNRACTATQRGQRWLFLVPYIVRANSEGSDEARLTLHCSPIWKVAYKNSTEHSVKAFEYNFSCFCNSFLLGYIWFCHRMGMDRSCEISHASSCISCTFIMQSSTEKKVPWKI